MIQELTEEKIKAAVQTVARYKVETGEEVTEELAIDMVFLKMAVKDAVLEAMSENKLC